MYFCRALMLLTAFSLSSAVFAAEQETAWKNLMLGAAENDAAHYTKGEGLLTKAILAQPNNPVALIQRGRCRWRQAKFGLSAADYTRAINLHPGRKLTIQALKFRATSDAALKKWRDCVADCNQLIKLNINDPFAYNRRGSAYEKLGQSELATRDAAASARIAPRSPAYRQATNLIKMDGGARSNLKRALDFLDRHLQNHPFDAEAYFERAGVNSQLGKSTETLADYDACVRLSPDRFSFNAERAKFLASMKRYKEAVSSFNDALLLAPGNDHLTLDRAGCYKDLGDYANSIKDYGALIELHPEDEDPLHYRARVYTLAKQYAKAINDYDRAIQLAPDQAGTYSERSKVYEKLGRHDLSVKDAQKASELLGAPIR
jgi:tetratricopeptide (TPR) repeat protein